MAWSYLKREGWEKVSDDVWPGYIRQPDGSFKAPPEPEPLKPVTRKQLIDALIDPAAQGRSEFE